MDPNMATEIDPLSMYEYPSFNYHHLHYPYPYDVKLEQPPTYVDNNTNINQQIPPVPNEPPQNVPQTSENNTPQAANYSQNTDDTGNAETKMETDIKPIFDLGKVKKESGKKSNYWSQKITDENFPFYACALCNVSYKLLRDLDSHLVDHKERLTSYDLRMKSKLKKKQMKKEQKKLKKLSKEVKLEVEIKPEDGYIGNETAEDFMNNSNANNPANSENTLSNDIINKVTEKVQEFLNNSTMNDSVNSQFLNHANTNDPVNNEASGSDKVNKTVENQDAVKNGETKSGEKEVEYNKDLEKIYKCSACQKQFSLSYYLKLHVRSHTDEKPYTCSECGQSFITASKLGRHNKRIHLAIKYQCRICYKIFTRFEYLTRHFDKKHAEDKLEGEPYDYNAILPYLKELEEQLREKAEKEAKPKTEALWDDWPEVEGAHYAPPDPAASDDKKNFDTHVMNHLDIVMDDVKLWQARLSCSNCMTPCCAQARDPVVPEKELTYSSFTSEDKYSKLTSSLDFPLEFLPCTGQQSPKAEVRSEKKTEAKKGKKSEVKSEKQSALKTEVKSDKETEVISDYYQLSDKQECQGKTASEDNSQESKADNRASEKAASKADKCTLKSEKCAETEDKCATKPEEQALKPEKKEKKAKGEARTPKAAPKATATPSVAESKAEDIKESEPVCCTSSKSVKSDPDASLAPSNFDPCFSPCQQEKILQDIMGKEEKKKKKSKTPKPPKPVKPPKEKLEKKASAKNKNAKPKPKDNKIKKKKSAEKMKRFEPRKLKNYPTFTQIGGSVGHNCCSCIDAMALYIKEFLRFSCSLTTGHPAQDTEFQERVCDMLNILRTMCRDCFYFVRYVLRFLFVN